MPEITRPAHGTETLKIERCPNCTGDVQVRDCGYSSFNPGAAECQSCKIKWELGNVDDQWDAGLKWNKLAKRIKGQLQLLDRIKVASKFSISRDFHAEDEDDEARKLLKQIRIHIVMGGEFKGLNNDS